MSVIEQIREMPDWHKDVLDQRELLIAEGKAHFIDWEQAKKEIWQETR
jgi:hypothetical protein